MPDLETLRRKIKLYELGCKRDFAEQLVEWSSSEDGQHKMVETCNAMGAKGRALLEVFATRETRNRLQHDGVQAVEVWRFR